MLDYNILFRWFLDMNLEQEGLDQSNFSRLRERLDDSPVACRCFDAVVAEARRLRPLEQSRGDEMKFIRSDLEISVSASGC